MDLPWFENPPGYQFLHCLINSAKGGNSSAVDAFAVADFLRKNEILVKNFCQEITIVILKRLTLQILKK